MNQPTPRFAPYQRLAEDARARAAAAPTEYIRRDYLQLIYLYEARTRADDGQGYGATA